MPFLILERRVAEESIDSTIIKGGKNMGSVFSRLQKIGKALMLPIAVLPAAGLLLRFGQGDLLNQPFIAQSGGAIFDNLALIFAIGVAIGLAKDNHGSAGLAGAIGYLVLTNAVVTINPDINMSVLAGIISGVVAGVLYNKFHDIQLPDFLAFFGGKRFVPIITAGVSIILAGIFGWIWPHIQDWINGLGAWIIGAGAAGAFVFGTLNRLLIPVGLHHVLNSFLWFVFGEYTDAAGNVVTGDLNRFFAGDPTAGTFMGGFFPIMMFALPAAAFAMYRMAKPENRAQVGGALFSVGLTAFLTGITEPIEFMFMFLAPVLYVLHSLLSGIALAVTSAMGIKHGFTFSAGAIDYFLNMKFATNGWLIIPIGLIFAVIYYFIFVAIIKKLDLPTPGRVSEESGTLDQLLKEKSMAEIAASYVVELGGSQNIVDIDACITRLRLSVQDTGIIKEEQLKKLGAAGIIVANKKNMQVIIGPKAELIASEIKRHL